MSPSYKIGRVQALLVVLFAVNALFTAAAQELKESPKPEAVVSPSAPVPALDPAATSPSSLEVTYRDGLLTIDAHNSSLADVLTAVAEKTGVAIDVPPSAASLERIVEHSGPGPATDVLSRLLNGSAFDFVIVGSPQAPHTPTRILLMVHASTTPATPSLPEPSVASAAGPEPRAYGVGFRVGAGDDDSSPTTSLPAAAAEPPQPSQDYLPGAVLDQMQKDRLRQRQQMQEQLQRSQQPPNPGSSQ